MTREEAISRLKEGAPFSELYYPDWEEALAMGIDALEAERVGKWIPVTERLPEGDKEVLVTSDWGFLYIAEYEVFSDGVGRWSETVEGRFIDVTAWMPLPEPYKEEVTE